MAVRDDGRIFVASRSNPTALNIVGVQVVTRNHEYFGQIGSYGKEAGQMVWPTALAVDKEHNLYLADESLHRITIYDKEGSLVCTWGTKGAGKASLMARRAWSSI